MYTRLRLSISAYTFVFGRIHAPAFLGGGSKEVPTCEPEFEQKNVVTRCGTALENAGQKTWQRLTWQVLRPAPLLVVPPLSKDVFAANPSPPKHLTELQSPGGTRNRPVRLTAAAVLNCP